MYDSLSCLKIRQCIRILYNIGGDGAAIGIEFLAPRPYGRSYTIEIDESAGR